MATPLWEISYVSTGNKEIATCLVEQDNFAAVLDTCIYYPEELPDDFPANMRDIVSIKLLNLSEPEL